MRADVLQGDCREMLKTLPAESVQCVVTSPPYFGLRDYGTATWQGGSESCDHQNGKLASDKSTLAGYSSEDVKIRTFGMKWHSECGKCGAVRQDAQIGLEQTPKAYVEQMVSVFREIRRVLRKDGVAWLNLGDSYSGYHGNKNAEMPTSALNGWTNGTNENLRTTTANRNGIKPKDLLMIPARVAIALCDDGWYLRSEIVWAKPNPMPESVTDRPTRAHEMIYLLSKSQTYYYDADAVREPNAPDMVLRAEKGHTRGGIPGGLDKGRNDVITFRSEGNRVIEANGRNKRSVWTVSTHPYAEAHFATFPEALIEPCILAGTSDKGCCPICLSPWERILDRERFGKAESATKMDDTMQGGPLARSRQAYRAAGLEGPPPAVTIGWKPTCSCSAGEPIPCTILDPFAGSGTTLRVANKHRRHAIGIELNPDYCTLIQKRTTNVQQTLPMEESI